LSLGLLDYAAGDKTGALLELKTAQSLGNAQTYRAQFESAAQRPLFQPILKDREFLKQLFPE
jgi:hypothetical protein